MKRTESDPSASEDFSFEAQSSNVEVTRGERLRNFYEEYIYKPGLVAWDDRRTRIGSFLLFGYILMGTLGVMLYRAPRINQTSRLNLVEGIPSRYVPPFTDLDVPLGTDNAGRDILAMTIHATDEMLLLVLSGACFATFMGVLIGTVAGYKGGTVDRVITSFNDTAMAIPGLPVVIVLAYGLQVTNPLLVGPIIMVNYWAGLARTLRSEVLKLREQSYVESSRAMGVSSGRILTKDILPNMMPYITVNFAFAARYVIFASVGLYFIGVLPAKAGRSWGYQISMAVSGPINALSTGINRYMVIPPLVAVMLLALSLVLIAQGLDRVFNPRVRTRLAGESESTVEGDEDEEVVAGGI